MLIERKGRTRGAHRDVIAVVESAASGAPVPRLPFVERQTQSLGHAVAGGRTRYRTLWQRVRPGGRLSERDLNPRPGVFGSCSTQLSYPTWPAAAAMAATGIDAVRTRCRGTRWRNCRAAAARRRTTSSCLGECDVHSMLTFFVGECRSRRRSRSAKGGRKRKEPRAGAPGEALVDGDQVPDRRIRTCQRVGGTSPPGPVTGLP